MLHFFWRHMRRGERGFTLIELLIVVAIIAILAAILIPNFLRARAQARVSASKGNLKNVGTALESYFVDNGAYPGTLGPLTGTPQYIRETPTDPCVGGTPNDYIYAIVGGSTNQDYRLDTRDWGTTGCGTIVTGLYYTPSGGLGVK